MACIYLYEMGIECSMKWNKGESWLATSWALSSGAVGALVHVAGQLGDSGLDSGDARLNGYVYVSV